MQFNFEEDGIKMKPADFSHLFFLIFFINISAVPSMRSSLCSNAVHLSLYKFERVGIIEVPLNKSKNSLKLNVKLVARGTLPTRYVGLIELADPEKLKKTEVNESELQRVKFRIRFPINKPLPFIKSILVDDEMLCSGNVNIFSYFGPVVTQISLQYILQYPLQSQNDASNLQSSSFTETSGDHHNKSLIAENCGQTNSSIKEIMFPRKISDWPWLAGIFVKSSSKVFLCSGTLISTQHIIIAAHCISNHDKVEELSVYFGNIQESTRAGTELSLSRNVSKLHINPFYKKDPFDTNVAILELSEQVKPNGKIKPACLWQQAPNNSPSILEAVGIVALWIVDFDGSLLPTNPSFIEVRIKDPHVCRLDDESWSYTLCTVALAELNWCPGVYGGELLIRQEDSHGAKWRVRGVIEFPFDYKSCVSSKQLLFTDVGMHSDWLGQILSLRT
nr:PREDICTED: transmembrane protease serine 11D-like isoform X1 [Bemisia tabaci]